MHLFRYREFVGTGVTCPLVVSGFGRNDEQICATWTEEHILLSNCLPLDVSCEFWRQCFNNISRIIASENIYAQLR